MRPFLRQLIPAVVALGIFTLVLGVVYPLVVTGIASAIFPRQAGGSVVERDGGPIGSELLGQQFTSPWYFHSRPSAAGDGYDAGASSGSNLGPRHPDLLATVEQRVAGYRADNGLGPEVAVPVDAVTASGSGLDPHISIANARLQAPRVALERGVPVEVVLDLLDEHTDDRALGILGEPGVNVLAVNLALDDLSAEG